MPRFALALQIDGEEILTVSERDYASLEAAEADALEGAIAILADELRAQRPNASISILVLDSEGARKSSVHLFGRATTLGDPRRQKG